MSHQCPTCRCHMARIIEQEKADLAGTLKRLAAAEERAQRAEAEKDSVLVTLGDVLLKTVAIEHHRDAVATVLAERDTVRAHVETLKASLRQLLSTARSGAPGFIEACAVAEKLLEEGT